MRAANRAMLLVAFFLALGAPCLAAVDEDLYNAGRNAVFEERWQEARRTFEDLTRRFPSSAFADDAQYWLGMAMYELGDPEKAYGLLKDLNSRFPESPWSDDSRVLMVRCAESALRAAAAHSPRGLGSSGRAQVGREAAEYEAFIEQSTHDSNAKVQLLAIDTMLFTNPGRAPELLPRLNAGRSSRGATELVLDRFFGGEKVKVTLENPALGMRDGNVAIMIREGDRISYLSLTDATELVRSPGATQPGRYAPAVVSEVKDKLLKAERNLVREGDPGTVQTLPGIGSRSMSAIVKVVDGEVHYYRNGDETVRILVLRRQAGFNADNIRIFVETRSGVREIALDNARILSSAGDPARTAGLSDATVRYLKAALAIIEIDLNRSSEAGLK